MAEKQYEVSNSRTKLEEITQRVEHAINHYEKVEETEPEMFSGLRRATEVDSTFSELADDLRGISYEQ